MEPVNVGVLGCGRVSPMYLPNLMRSPFVEIVAVSDLDSGLAEAAAKQHGIPNAVAPEELLRDVEVELVLNLTPISRHAATTASALAAGKHVYSEKPLATTVDEARRLVDEADKRGLVLACAPDTLLGTGFQESLAQVNEGAIGRPLGGQAAMLRGEAPWPAYAAGPFGLFDMGPYYLTALIELFGPARRVTSIAEMLTEEQTAAVGAELTFSFSAILEFENRRVANLLLAWGTNERREVPFLTVYGTTGVLELPNPNFFGDEPAVVRSYRGSLSEVPGSRRPEHWPRNLRGLGVAETCAAIRERRRPRAAADLACHVVEILCGIVRSAEQGRHVELETTCSMPAPLPGGAGAALLGL